MLHKHVKEVASLITYSSHVCFPFDQTGSEANSDSTSLGSKMLLITGMFKILKNDAYVPCYFSLDNIVSV